MPGFCAVKEAVLVRAAATMCQWPRGMELTYTIAEKLEEFSDDEYKDLCEMAFMPWEARSNFSCHYVSTGFANIVLTTRHMDGAFGVLAEAELPCGNIGPQTQLRMWADTSEDWVQAENPSGRMIDALRVFIHEAGHLLGMPHVTDRPAIMNPSISEIRTLQPADLEMVIARYGEKVLVPVPPPPTPPSDTPCDLLVPCLEAMFTKPEAKRQMEHSPQLLGRGWKTQTGGNV